MAYFSNSIYIIALCLCHIFLKSNSLQCYECYNCNGVNDTYLTTCGAITSTSTASTGSTVSSSSTASTESTVTIGSTDSTVSTASPGSTNSTGSTASTGSSANTEPTASTASTANIGTTASTASTANTGSTAAGSSSTESSSSSSVVGSAASRVRNEPNDCVCENEENCDCTANSILGIKVRATSDVSYFCLKATTKVNNTDVIIRTCAVKSENTTICDDVTEAINATQCSVCDTDKCNGAVTIKVSVPILISITFLLIQIKI